MTSLSLPLKKVLSIVLSLVMSTALFSQELPVDEHTLLLLHFNNSVVGAQNDHPWLWSEFPNGVRFSEGVFGSALAHDEYAPDIIFDTAQNVNTKEGTVEFWLKPENFEGAGYVFDMRITNGMFIEVGYWTSIYVNTFAENPNPQVHATIPGAAWFPGKWYHLAFTWGHGQLKIFLNGQLLTENFYDFELSTMHSRAFTIASNLEGGNDYFGLLDELRISDIARSEAEIYEDFLMGWEGVEKIVVHPSNISLYKGWQVHLNDPAGYQTPQVYRKKGSDSTLINSAAIVWSVSDPYIIQIDESSSTLKANEPGYAELIGMVDGEEFKIPITVRLPVLPEERVSEIDPFLATPAFCYNKLVPVAVLIYLPTVDRVNIDIKEVPNVNQSLELVKQRSLETAKFTKFSLEEGSKFRGYQNPDAAPYLGYQVIEYVYVYEPLPRGFKSPGNGWFADFNVIMERFNGKKLVDSLGVKEVWLFGYDIGEIAAVESNMSSAKTGDISNSYRIANDLPVYDNSYIVYNNNIQRGGNEAVHNHGHQIESMLTYSATLAHGNADLFWQNFVGRSGPNYSNPPLGRCGDTHHPPNTTTDYDYCNSRLVASDIFDWKPEGGTTTLVNCDTWASIPYAWPDGVAHDANSNFFILWMQSLPGYGNEIPVNNGYLTNWWKIISDWDNHYALGLHRQEKSEVAPICKSIVSSNVDIDALCAGLMDTVQYTSENILFGGENLFTVQLSDSNGDFSAPIDIASLYSFELSGTISFTLPYSLPAGTNYRIRINSTRPVRTGAPSNSFAIKATPLPPAITPGGPIAFCEGQDVILKSSVTRNINWYRNYERLKIRKDQLRVVSDGSYWVTAFSQECESMASNVVYVTVNPTPPRPEFYQSGNTLISSSSEGNQWFRNGQPIAGATENSYTPTISGRYQVQVITEYSCESPLSKAQHITVNDVNARDEAVQEISVYPNPVENTLFIVRDANSPSVRIRLLDFAGHERMVLRTANPLTEIDISALSPGIYVLKVDDGKEVILTKRVLKK